MTGLTTALALAERGARVTVFDSAPTSGGLSAAHDYGLFTWDRFYHVISPADSALKGLLDRIGMSDSIRWTPTRTGIRIDGQLRGLNSPLDLLRLPKIPMLAKLRIGWMAARVPRIPESDALDRESAVDFLKRHCGNAGYERFWRHLLRAKLGHAATKVSARFIHATVKRLANARNAKGSSEQFGQVDGGYHAILGALEATLTRSGATIRTGARVELVRDVEGGVNVSGSVDGQPHAEQFDAAIVTTPNPTLSTLLPDLDADVREKLASTTMLGAVCTNVVGKSPLSDNYILNLVEDGFSITGILEMTNVIDREQTAGRTLVYLPRYEVRGDPLFEASDASIKDQAVADLQRVYPHTTDGWIESISVHRATMIQPLPCTGEAPIAPPRDVVPGKIWAVNSAQLPTCILNNNDCIGLADAAVEALWPALTPAN